MICLGCFREVPDLVGPDTDLCPECHGLSAEDFVPSLAAAWPLEATAEDDDFFRELAEDFAALLAELDDSDDFGDLAGPANFPTFQGRPRF